MKIRIAIYLLMISCLTVSALQARENQTIFATLENGMKLVLKENHSSPMITSVVFINAGSRYEDPQTNGLTHFLEHLLFNGTKNRSGQELTETIEEYGGYINAFTRKDLTAYLVLMPKEHIDIGLDIQSDQLFNSTIPEDKLAKERKIVVEEIRMNNDVPETQVEYFFNEVVFAGTPYARTVLGSPDHINSIPRQAILDYYEDYYIPNNMIALVIGDFETEAMIEKMNTFYGHFEKGRMPKIDLVNFRIPEERKVVETELETKSYHVDLAFPAPHYSDPDYYPYFMMVEYLASGATSPLTKQIEDKGLASSVSASLMTQKDFSIMRISAMTDSRKKADAVVWEINRILSDPKLLTPSFDTYNGLIVSQKTQDIYLREKLHYYGFIIAPMMVSTGYEFLENLTDSLEQVDPLEIEHIAGKYFADINYLGTLVTPRETAEKELNPSAEVNTSHHVLDNGLTLIVKQNPDSRVFAVNIFGKNRGAMEPPGRDGITDFLNRMMERGTKKYDKQTLSEKLANIGAQVTVTDNPYIPYDDRYTSRQYAFFKFETIDEYASDGVELLAEMIKHPRLDSAEISSVKQEMMAALGMASASTYQTCRNSFYRLMFGEDHPLAKVPLGTHRTIMPISKAELEAYHRRFYAPNNMIMTVCTNLGTEWVLNQVRGNFGSMEKVSLGTINIAKPSKPQGAVAVNSPMDKEQVYIYLGCPTISIGHPDYPALKVATDILSSRMSLELRESQGLAYSVGAGVASTPDFGWFLATMGTGRDNIEIAREGILSEIDKMKTGPVNTEELLKAQNSIWGSSLTRQLSRINQAYYLTWYEFMGVGYDYQDIYMEAIKQVTIEDVQRVAEKYFPSEGNYYLATAGLSD
ncbi:MAG: hypothetical protein GF404_13775 [candidate division Zixibacteria bacterium]|nr:hypothetical protein [candidate division Zixibacteria bacterium]